MQGFRGPVGWMGSGLGSDSLPTLPTEARMAKFDPPLLVEGALSGSVFVVTHGKRRPHPTIADEELIEASVKYDVTDQFEELAAKRSAQEVKADDPRAAQGA